ncbi:uncharacterized protein Gasu_61850 [Galdieria sulphuraria]|uniref:FAS1 domain-containing protein n=1 Tax=Galdieria sulphuraria TaxID=130081 RepID=M2X8J9_GALSU|nr:uncharacterized protein Gasu_61850 [Galdieria sulphuraria]EME26172.1 hypothetical protein Gasu_61850 [Galdieria sulphuraria]|eukprot:XP_005702692.1 hypothetical protein Gasu_61850 [Galdieria sulphuraria]
MQFLVLIVAVLFLQESFIKAESIGFQSSSERVAAPKSPIEVFQSQGLTTFLKAVNETGLGPLFEGINDNFTIFAPTNEAFQDLNNVSTIFANSGTLETLILYQVVPGALTTSDIVSQFEKEGVGTLNSVNNLEILVFVRPNGTILLGTDEASLVTTNLSAGNSVIQVISRVLVPPVTNFLLGPTVIPTAPSAPTSADAGVSTTSISSSLPQTTFA